MKAEVKPKPSPLLRLDFIICFSHIGFTFDRTFSLQMIRSYMLSSNIASDSEDNKNQMLEK